MHGKLHIEPKYRSFFSFADKKTPFESLSEYFGYKLGKDQRRRSKVCRKTLTTPSGESITVYFKLYGYRRLRRALSRIFKPTRSRSEFANLKFFRELGIPACEPIAQGEYRNGFGIARNCMIITVEVPGSKQLDQFIDELETSDDTPANKKNIRRQITISIASNLRKLHDRQFFHRDLKWRNLLVRRVGNDGDEVEVVWIDCPHGHFDRTGGLFSKRGVIKDLATFYHGAINRYTKEEQMNFLSLYSGMEIDDPKLIELAQKVAAYQKRKLDD